MLAFAVASFVLLAPQRSESEIQWRRKTSNVFTPTMERMMRSTDTQLLTFAGSVKIDERSAAVGEIVQRNLKPAARIMVGYLWPKVRTEKELAPLQIVTIDGLGRLGDPVAIPALRKTLGSRMLSVRTASALSLGLLGDRNSAPGMRRLLKDLDEKNQRQVVIILGKFEDRGSEPEIRQILKNARYNGLRATAATALGSIGNKRASSSALIAALSDPYPDVRCAAANSLAKLKVGQAVPALRVALKTPSPQATNAPRMEQRSIMAIRDALKTLGAG